MGKRTVFGAIALGFTCVIAGCSADSTANNDAYTAGGRGQPGRPDKEGVAGASKGYDADVDWLVRTYGDCQRQLAETGECVFSTSDGAKPTSIVVKSGSIKPQDLNAIRISVEQAAENVRQFSAAVAEVTKNGICNLVAPFADAQSPYVWLGVGASYGAGGAIGGNVDLVYDLRRKQAAVFTGMSAQLGTQVGGGVSAYAGMAFGACDASKPQTNLLDAWQTPNCSATVSFGLPWKLLSLDVQAMTSADGCMRGGTVGVGAGLSAHPLPINGNVSRPVDGVGGPWNGGTEALTSYGEGSRSLQCEQRNADGSCADGKAYVQFATARDMAIHLALLLGPQVGAVTAASVLALDELESRGLAIDQACPNEVAAERARRTPPEAVQALCNPAVSDTNACVGRPDDDYCGSEIGHSAATSKIGCRNGRVVVITPCVGSCEREYQTAERPQGYTYCLN